MGGHYYNSIGNGLSITIPVRAGSNEFLLKNKNFIHSIIL